MRKEYYQKNKDSIKEKIKVYKENNKEKISLKNKEYNKKRREDPEFKLKEKIRIKEWKQKNKEKISLQNKDYINKKIESDPLFKLKNNVRRTIRNSFICKGYKKNTKTETLLGCSFEEFKLHLEKQFKSWMSWDNQGNPKDGLLELNKSWDIDHIIPLSSAMTEEEIIKLNHYTNLQPLCSKINRHIKKDNLDFII